MYSIIEQQNSFQHWVEQAHQSDVIAIDTEFMRVNTYWPELALVQAESQGTATVIDPLVINLTSLGTVFDRLSVRKVMHSASEDLIALSPLMNQGMAGLFDTQIAAAFAGFGSGVGYQKLVFTVLGVELEKSQTRSDWLARPLTKQQFEYAAADVIHLRQLHDELVDRLDNRGMLAWCIEDCDRLCTSVLNQSKLQEQPHLEFKTLWKWADEKQARLRQVLIWRENIARQINRPKFWLFDNPTAIDMVEKKPKSLSELSVFFGKRQYLNQEQQLELLKLINEGEENSVLAFMPIAKPFNLDEERQFQALRNAVENRAQQLDLPSALLCSRRTLEMVLQGQSNQLMQGWRREVLRSDFLAFGVTL